MPYMAFCEDSSAAEELRQTHLQEHLDYIESITENIFVAGPTTKRAHSYDGSCFIYRTDDLETAQSLLRNDPYYAKGVYKTCTFMNFLPAAGTWIGGCVWKGG